MPVLKVELYKFVADRLITLEYSSLVVTHGKHTGAHKIVTGPTLTVTYCIITRVNDMWWCKLHVFCTYKQWSANVEIVDNMKMAVMGGLICVVVIKMSFFLLFCCDEASSLRQTSWGHIHKSTLYFCRRVPSTNPSKVKINLNNV